MKKLYRFYWDCGRQGDVRGIFVANEADVQGAVGRRVNFGEILGKHSEIAGILDMKDLEVITDDPNFIAWFEHYKCETGYNPMEYLRDE